MKLRYRFLSLAIVVLMIMAQLVVPVAPAAPAQASVSWAKYSGNPVFDEGIFSGAPMVVYDSDQHIYKMWYVRGTGNVTRLDSFFGDIRALGLTSLIDDLRGAGWTAVADNDTAQIKSVIDHLAGMSVGQIDDLLSGVSSFVSYATSVDGITWQPQGSALSGSVDWDYYIIGKPAVIRNSATSYEMWYTGWKMDTAKLKVLLGDLALLSADDLKSILTPLANRDMLGFVSAIREARGDTYILETIVHFVELLGASPMSIGHATSTDGVNWTKDTANPVVTGGTGYVWDRYGATSPSVVKTGTNSYEMWYTGFELKYDVLFGLLGALTISDVEESLLAGVNMAIGRATSTDGTVWSKYSGNPVLSKGSETAWDSYGVGIPSVVRNSSSSYELWYTGMKLVPSVFRDFLKVDVAFNDALLNGTSDAVGHATSANGISWTKDTANPVLSRGTGDVWDKYGAGTPSVVKIGDVLQMWYTGAKSNPKSALFDILDGASVYEALQNTRVSIGYASTGLRTLQSITVTPSSTSVAMGKTRQFFATAAFSDGTSENITSSSGTVWASSNTPRATINASTGLATGVSLGTAMITASRLGVTSNEAALNVTSPELSSITVTPDSPSVALGRIEQFAATGGFSDNSTADLTSVVSWTSSNTTRATISALGLAATLAQGATTITASLSGVSGNTTLTVGAAEFDYLLVAPDNPVIADGDSLQLTALEYYTDGSTISRTSSATWDSDNGTVAGITSGGLATGLAVGSTTVTAIYGSYSDNTVLTVTPAALQSMTITETAPSVAAGKATQLHVTGTYSDNTSGVDLTADNNTVWASLNLAVATVSGTGLVTGVAPGTVTVRATNSGARASVTVNVTAPTLEAIAVTPATPTLVEGNTLQFVATGTYSDNSTQTITGNVTWESDNGTVASISTGGFATSLAAGTTAISATSGAVSGNTTLTVTNATLSSIAVTPDSPSVAAGKTKLFTATGTYSDNSTANLTAQVTWTSGATGIATISSGGLATGQAIGGSLITATLGTVFDNTTLTVTAAELESIAVTPASPSVAAGKTKQFTATGTFSNGTTQNLTTSSTWASDNGTVASVSSTGLASGLVVGTSVISADYGLVSGNTTLTVTAAVINSIAVTPAGSSVAAGKTKQYTAMATYSNNTTVDITATATWASSNTGLASISSTGLATGRTVGTATITATKSGVSGGTTLAITVAELDSVTVTPATPTITAGATRQFRAVGTYTNGTNIDITTSALWASDNGTVASITSAGLATALAAGTTNITATLGLKSGTTTLAVTAATLSSIAVTPATDSVAAGKTRQFTATGTYSDNATVDLTNFVTWSSSATNIARIGATGLATTYTTGSTNITASMSGRTSPAAVLTATAAVLDSVRITPVDPAITFISGAAPTMQFTAMGINSDGTMSDVTSSATWASSVGGVATISGGLATTVGAGTTFITAGKDGKTDNVTLIVRADTVAPAITLSSPTRGLVTNDKNLTVSGRVDDKSATTKVVVNGGSPVTMSLDSQGNFSKGVLLDNGSNTIAVQAVDGVGNTGTTGAITIVVDANKPAIVITSPTENMLTNTAVHTVTGTISGATAATLVLNGSSRNITPSSGSFSASVTLTEGVNIIVVKAYSTGHDNDADYLGTSGARKVTLDTVAPAVTITAPVPNGVVSLSDMMVSGTVNDPSVTSATLTLNGVPAAVTVVNGSFNHLVTLAPGANTIRVIASDRAGNASPGSPVIVSLDTSKPQVTITSPDNRLVTNIAGQTVSGTVSDTSITSALLYLNGSSQAIAVASDGTFSVVVTLNSGANTIEVRASDSASPPNAGTSGAITVTLDRTAPTLSIGLSDPTDSITITVTSNEELAAAPTVTVSGSVTMNPIDVNKWSGVYGSAASPIATGSYTVTVTGTDKAGNSSSQTATFSKETIDVDGVTPTTVSGDTTTLNVETNGAVSDASITFTQHLNNPSGNVGNPTDATGTAGVFLEINVSPELRDNLKQIYITVNYDPATLGSTEASTLKLYLWDLTSGTWQLVPGSGVNVAEHYIFGTVTHLSEFGGFGTTTVTSAPSGPAPSVPGTTNLAGYITSGGKFTAEVVATSDDDICKLTIPVNTIGLKSGGAALESITMTRILQEPPPVAIPASTKLMGLMYEFGPDGATFEPAVTLTVKYSAADVPSGVSEEKLYIAYWNTASASWVPLPSTVDTTNHTVTASISHFTKFAAMVSTRPASFVLSGLTISPTTVKTGEQINVSIQIANTGDVAGTQTVTLKVNSAVVNSRDVTLAGGQSQAVSFFFTRDTAGVCTVDVNGMTGTVTVTAPVSPTPPPAAAVFTIGALTVSPDIAGLGETVTITVTVANTGAASGSYDVILKLNGQTVTTKKVTLSGGASEKVSFTSSQAAAGIYTIDVNGLAGKFTVVKPAAFSVSGLTIEPAETAIGQAVVISVLAANNGEASGKYQVILKLNNATIETREVSLAGGQSERVIFTVSRDTAGSYTVEVNGLKGTFNVKAAAPTAIPWWLIGSLIVVIMAAIIGIWVWKRRQS